jgi:hypothetical protein
LRPSTYVLASIGLVTLLPAALVTSFLPLVGGNLANCAMAQSSGAQSSSTQSSGAQSSSTQLISAPQSDSHAQVSSEAKTKAKKGKRTKNKGDDFSGDRDCNMFQLEPTVINERYYTSGKAEHYQKISPTLPPGAPIPDNEGPYAPETKPQVTGSGEKLNDKLDSQVKASLTALKDVKGDSPTLKLKLRVSTVNDALLAQLKELKVDVISTSRASGDMIVYAPAHKVNEIGNLNQVLIVLLAQ